MDWNLPTRMISFPRRPLLMGIVNVNDDSFCGDGTLDVKEALEQAREQIVCGADIIDVGAESARTNRKAIAIEEEVTRFSAFLKGWQEMLAKAQPRDVEQVWPPILSANTWRSEVVEAILPLGVELLNDMGGLSVSRNAELCAQYGTSLLIMHSVGEPKVPHLSQRWDDVMSAMEAFFTEKLETAKKVGLKKEQLIFDPGIDFAKQRDDNLAVYRELSRLHQFGCPIMLPISRKTVIGEVLGIEAPQERDAGTIACLTAGMMQGAQIFRVHNVEAAWQATKVIWELTRSEGSSSDWRL